MGLFDNKESNVGQFGADNTNIIRYKQAGEYAADSKYWALKAKDFYDEAGDLVEQVTEASETANKAVEVANASLETAKEAVDIANESIGKSQDLYDKMVITKGEVDQTAANVKTSENNAKASEVASKISETNSKTSETNAKASADKAEQMKNQTQQIITDAGDRSTLVRLAEPDGYNLIGEVKSIEALRLLEPTTPKQKVKVRSYYEDSNMGGGYFYYNDSLTNPVDNKGTIILTASGKAWVRVYTELWLEDFGGGTGLDDSEAMELSQQNNSGPIKVVPNKTYYFKTPVKHKSGGGWIGDNTTFKCLTDGSRLPFITSIKTQTGADNDLVHGTSAVSNIIFEGIIIDTNYTDSTGVLGFQYAENTLDSWKDCSFKRTTFTNSKFDCLALQNNCDRITFSECVFSNAGQDGVTIRHTCQNTSFVNKTKILNTALVTLSGAKSGDGIVNKGKHTLIDGCYFNNVGNKIKGAGIANNAEDVENVTQASYGIYTNNIFEDCYGGLGIGTVNPDFIAAGTYIEGIVCANNTFINTSANAIGVRYVSNFSTTNNMVIGQTLQNYNAVELIYVNNHSGDYQVKNTAGGAILIQNTNGKVSLEALKVSTAGALNGFTVSASTNLDLDFNIKDVNRRLGSLSTVTNSNIRIIGSKPSTSGVDLTSVNNSCVNINLSEIPQYGITSTTCSNNSLTFILNNISTGTNEGYSSIDLVSGSLNIVDVVSTTTSTNKPRYDITVRDANTQVILRSCIYKAGSVGRTNITAGANVIKGIEVV